jgi:hypothetical protein
VSFSLVIAVFPTVSLGRLNELNSLILSILASRCMSILVVAVVAISNFRAQVKGEQSVDRRHQ